MVNNSSLHIILLVLCIWNVAGDRVSESSVVPTKGYYDWLSKIRQQTTTEEAYPDNAYQKNYSSTHEASAATGEFRSDYQYNNEARGWIKFHQVPTTWLEARLKCYYEGAVLMSPSNDRLYAVMQKLVLSRIGPTFIGIQSLTPTGDYLSVEGVDLLKMPAEWSAGEPDNKANKERCLSMAPNGGLADVDCEDFHPYICYKEMAGNETITECGTWDREYTLESTGSCYKFHPDCVTWSRALMICASEGGHLVVLNSPEEADMLKQRYGTLNANCPEIPDRRFISVGFHNPYFDQVHWFTIDGKRLEEAGYDRWAKEEPNNHGGNEYCGSFIRNGEDGLNDMPCDHRLPFVCEIPVAKS